MKTNKRARQTRLANINTFSMLGLSLFSLLPLAVANAADCAIAQSALASRISSDAINHCPAARAGQDMPILVGQVAQLDATASSDADGDPISFVWSLVSAPAGSGVQITSPNAMRASFVPDQIGDYVFELAAMDAKGAVMTDTVRYSTANIAPVANAGSDLRASVGEWLVLGAERSYDMNDDVLKYEWQLVEAPARSAASLQSDRASADLYIDAPGDYVAQLMVSDGFTTSVADSVRISTNNSIPVANAGRDRRFAPSSTVSLSGEQSRDLDGAGLSYSWSLVSAPAASAVKFSNVDEVSPTVFLEEEGLYLFQLIVNDAELVSVADTVVVEVVADRLENVDPRDYRHMVTRGADDDTDGDGILDLDDNCVLDANPDQRDTDGDGIGNRCDPDLNNDGVVNAADLGLLKAAFFSSNADADLDGNGIVNFADLGILKSRFFLPPGPAGLIIWVSLVDGDWANRMNWQPQTVPSAGSAALISVGPDVVVTSTSDTATVKTLTNEETLALSSSTFEATASIENGSLITMQFSTLNNTLVEPSMSGSGLLEMLIGGSTWRNVTLDIDTLMNNASTVNSFDALTLNSTLTIDAPSSTTGVTFSNSQSLSGTGTVVLNGVGNTVISEPRLFPNNSTTLTVGPGITIRGGKGRVGQGFGNVIMNGTMTADVSGETLLLNGSSLSGAATFNALNGGSIEIAGNYDNVSGTPIVIDAAGGGVSLANGSALRNVTVNGTAGTDIQIPIGSYTFQNALINSDLTLANGATISSTDGLTLNNTTTINAPASTTGIQFTNSQTLDGAGTIVFNGTGNSVVAEPRLFPLNGTTLTVGPNITVRGGTGTIGQGFASLEFGGMLIADVAGEELVIGGTSWSADQSVQAINDGEIRFFGNMNNANAALAIDTLDGGLSASSGATFTDVTLDATANSVLNLPAGSFSMTDVVADIDMALANAAVVNVTDGMVMNGTATINAPASVTGFQFVNTQTLTGTGTFIFDATGNNVIGEPRLFPLNGTTLTVDSGITVRGGNATIGQGFATLNFGGTLISEKAGEQLLIGGTLWTADQVLQATGGGEIRFFGNLDNGGDSFTLNAPGDVTSVTAGAALRNATIDGTAGTEVRFLAGTSTIDNLTMNADVRYVNGAISNVSNGLTLNGTATIEGTTLVTGMVFVNSQSLLGSATVVFDSAGNGVISEPRLFPNNGTVLTIGSNIAIEGATGTVGNGFASLVLNGSVTANVADEPILITGTWSGSGSITALNGGEIRLAGTLDNGGGAINVDGAGGSVNVQAGAILRNVTIAGALGNDMNFNSGAGTLQNVVMNSDMTLVNGSTLSVSDGLVLNGTATFNAPSLITGMTFINTQTLGGTGTVVINGAGNSVISEPRLFPNNGTVLTIGPGLTVRGGNGRIGNAFASVIVEGVVSADSETIEMVGGSATNFGLLEAVSGATLSIDNLVPGAGGGLHAGAGSQITLLDSYTMLPSTVTSIDIDNPMGLGSGVINAGSNTVNYNGTANISAVNGYAPGLGDSFALVTHDAFGGAFATVNSLGLGGGQSFGVTYSSAQSTATVQ